MIMCHVILWMLQCRMCRISVKDYILRNLVLGKI
nr:MAG TPA: hypothetical protein [Caudoviricetes sp.]